MSSTSRWLKASMAAVLTVVVVGCEEEKESPPATTPPVTPTVSAAVVASSEPAAKPKEPKPSHACPEGSKGEGTFDAPCIAEKKGARVMEVKWTGKTTDKGPSFQVVSKSDLEILYGQVVVYFYDKAGKQLEMPGAEATGTAKTRQKCSGNIFAGPMKPKEKAVLWFSCVGKKHVPEGTASIEAEMQTVGFTAENGNKADTYWRNDALAPEERPKGGVK